MRPPIFYKANIKVPSGWARNRRFKKTTIAIFVAKMSRPEIKNTWVFMGIF